MADNTNSPLSYQTTMPEYPDTSFGAYANATQPNSAFGTSRLWIELQNFLDGHDSYKQWRNNLLDDYNAKMSAYNTWLQTGEGLRASLESGNYNPSYFNNGSASASPLSYQKPEDSLEFMMSGIGGIFQFAQALQSIKMASEQIAGQELKNENQQIVNDYQERLLSGKVAGLNLSNDRRQFEIEQLFYPRWSDRPELWKNGVFSPYGRGTYDLRDAEKGLGYQKAVADLDYLRAGVALRNSQKALYNASEREKKWYYDNVQEIQRDILVHHRDILKGEYDFQKVEQKLRKRAIYSNIGLGIANAAINAIKVFTPGGLLSSGGVSPSIQQPQWNYPYTTSWSGGVDILNGEIYSGYRPY